jgi:anti-sigma regulatory factor (Ser/Thr protein kinase)
VMLAVHELAANTVHHGPGHGRLRIHVTASTLHCEVSDPGLSCRDGRAPDGTGGQAPGTPGAVPWPVEQGHGLWLVHTAADHLRVTSGPHGSLITACCTARHPRPGCPPPSINPRPGSGGLVAVGRWGVGAAWCSATSLMISLVSRARCCAALRAAL